MNRTIYKPEPIAGYPEWLPEARLIELRWIDHLRSVFESFGFCSIETPAVEEIDALTAKGGESDKEIYAIHRLQAAADESEPRVALHYDLTVPMARYVAQHYNDLVFPFKRYQIQKAWRGERPQEGRFREFYQCDIDVVDNGAVSLEFDVELPQIIYRSLSGLEIGTFSIHINNRKLLQGFYEALGIADVQEAIRIVDKLDKIGMAGVTALLRDKLCLADSVVGKCVELATIRTTDSSFRAKVLALAEGEPSTLLAEGLEELGYVMDGLQALPPGSVYADLSIARGLDYYTGTVYEAKLTRYPGYPSICSGGRYENLVGAYLKRPLPGVGMSIGLTRIFSKLLKEGQITLGAKTPTHVLVALTQASDIDIARKLASDLRRRSINVELFHEPKKIAAQIRYANRKGIRYVAFPNRLEEHEIKDLIGEQQFPLREDWRPH